MNEYQSTTANENEKRQLNILHLINVRWYNACAYYAVALAAAQKNSGYNVKLAGDPDTPLMKIANRMGLDFDNRPRLSSYWPTRIFTNMLWLKKMVTQNKYQIVIAHRGEAHSIAVLVKKLLGIDFTLIRVRGDVRPPKYDLFNKFLYYKSTDGVICSSEKLRNDYSMYFNIDAERIMTIPAGIDIEYYNNCPSVQETKRKLGIAENEKVITVLGRLSPIKGHKSFIQAAGIVNRKFNNLNYIIAGEECEVTNDDLQQWIKEHCPYSKFYLPGLVDDVREILAATDIAIVPSLGSEMIARVGLEFMAAGKPVIASKINALEELVETNKGGYLFEAGDADQLADRIVALLDNPHKMTAFGEYNRELIMRKYSSQKWAEDSIEFYRKLIDLKDKRQNG